jgi:hypothetical protein
MTERTRQLRVPRATVVAAILSAHGFPVSSPDDGDLDDLEMERWEVCLEIVDRLCEPEA